MKAKQSILTKVFVFVVILIFFSVVKRSTLASDIRNHSDGTCQIPEESSNGGGIFRDNDKDKLIQQQHDLILQLQDENHKLKIELDACKKRR